MAGHARERRPGVWELRAYAGRDPLTGRKITETKTVRGKYTKAEAQRLADEFAVEVRREPIDSADMTFGELLERWFTVAGPRMVPAGQRETRWQIDRRLAPLHDKKLSVIAGRTGTAILDEFYSALRERGGLCRRRDKCSEQPCRHGDVCALDGKCDRVPCEHGGGGPLADGSVVRTNVVVSAALQQAVVWGLIARNPAEHAFAGEPDPEEIDPPSPAQVVQLFELAAAIDPELVVFLILASTTGQRPGAVGALWWNELDLEKGTVTFGHVLSVGAGGVQRVRRGKGKRNKKGKGKPIPLDPAILAVLLAHRERCLHRCALAGVELPEAGYVFAGDGVGREGWHPRTVARYFSKIRAEIGLDKTRLYDLRHFVITYLLTSGVDLAVVKGIVGHSATSLTTLDVYAHAPDPKKREATGILARLLGIEAPPEPEPEPPAEGLAKVIPMRRRDVG